MKIGEKGKDPMVRIVRSGKKGIILIFPYSMTNFCLTLLALIRKETSSDRGSSFKQFSVEKVTR